MPIPSERRLADRVAVVTGAATGIGRATAVRLAREGARVVVNHFATPEEAAQTVRVCRQTVPDAELLAVDADVSQPEAVERLFDEVQARFGVCEILVNNAGILEPQSAAHELDLEAFERVLAVNLRGAVLCATAAIRRLVETGRPGAIVNVSSVHQTIPKPGFLAYSISKGALSNLTRTLALEYADRRIRVNAVGPGAIETPLNAAWASDRQARAVVESHIPMGRVGAPEEIAAVVAFLASDEASYVTGQTLYACGGLSLYPEFRENWAS